MPLLTRPRVSHGPRGRVAGWRAVAAALLSLLLVAVGVSASDASVPPAAKTEEVSEALPELVVSPPTSVLSENSSSYDFTVLVRNPGKQDLPSGTLALHLNPQRVESLKGLDTDFPASSVLLETVEFSRVDAESERSVTLSVPRASLPLTASSVAGVYLVQASLTPGNAGDDPAPATPAPATQSPTPSADAAKSDAEATDSSGISDVVPFVWRGSGGSAVKVSFIVPLVLPSTISTMPTPEQLGEVTPKLDELLTTATRERATLAIDPRLIAGIRAYGEDSPKAARQFLSRLEATDLPTFLLQFADADPSAQAALGFTELLEPTSLTFITRLGTFTPSDDPTPTDESADSETNADTNKDATPGESDAQADTAPGGAPDGAADHSGSGTVPTLQELLQWPRSELVAWPAEGSVDSGTLALLKKSSVSSLILDSSNVTYSGGPQAAMGDTSTLITDSSLATSARDALSARTDTERSAALAGAAAELALAAQAGSPGLVLGFDRGATAENPDPAGLLKDLGSFDWVIPVPQTEQATGKATLKSSGTLEERRELLRSAVNREPSVDEVSKILVHPNYLTGYQRTRLLNLFATRYANLDSNFEQTFKTYHERDEELLKGVRTINTRNTQLVGTSTRVPVQLRNSLPFDALVAVQADSVSAALSLPETHFPDVSVKADGTSRILVPVRSRVSSGESGLVIRVTDASGDFTVYKKTLSISIRSSVETIALWTLGILATLLLSFGIWRSIRRRRSLKQTQPPTPEPPGIART